VGQKLSATHAPARVYNSRSGGAWDCYASLRLRIGLGDIAVKPKIPTRSTPRSQFLDSPHHEFREFRRSLAKSGVLESFDLDRESAEGIEILPLMARA
jgi:hypothetical protein